MGLGHPLHLAHYDDDVVAAHATLVGSRLPCYSRLYTRSWELGIEDGENRYGARYLTLFR